MENLDKIVLKEFKQRMWMVAEVWKNGKKIADINRFYKVTDEWIFIYGTEGGQGTGYVQGDLLRKIFIGDCEFKKEIN